MKTVTLKNQRGAVLAFSLVMLLLLMLASTSMIQQNKAQIGVATNAGQQVTAFANVETALRSTQAALAVLRYDSAPYPPATGAATHCKSGASNSVHVNTDVAPTGSLFTATVKAEYCISNYDDLAGGGNEYRCFYNSDGTRNTVVGSRVAANLTATPPVYAVPSVDEVAACNKLTAAGWRGAGVANPDFCHIEVYTVHVTLNDVTTGASRTVESKFQIECSGDRYG